MTATFKKLWKNEYIQTAMVVGLIVLIVLGFWFGIQMLLNTPYPALAVESGSMCIPEGMYCDGWSHPFARTLHIGDLIILQGIDLKEIKAAPYPEGDIIVFQRPKLREDLPDDLIVHRVIATTIGENGLMYFKTKGDGNTLPDGWTDDYRGINYSQNGMVSEKMVLGKVVMRIPWIGHAILFMHNSMGLPIIIALMIMLVFIEFILPLLRKKAPVAEPEQQKETQQQL